MAVGDQKTITVDGTDYILQKPPARWVLQVTDRAKNKFGIVQSEKYTDELLKGVVVDPKIGLDDVEDITSLTSIVSEIENFLGNK